MSKIVWTNWTLIQPGRRNRHSAYLKCGVCDKVRSIVLFLWCSIISYDTELTRVMIKRVTTGLFREFATL